MYMTTRRVPQAPHIRIGRFAATAMARAMTNSVLPTPVSPMTIHRDVVESAIPMRKSRGGSFFVAHASAVVVCRSGAGGRLLTTEPSSGRRVAASLA
jgi:hypothetical protein